MCLCPSPVPSIRLGLLGPALDGHPQWWLGRLVGSTGSLISWHLSLSTSSVSSLWIRHFVPNRRSSSCAFRVGNIKKKNGHLPFSSCNSLRPLSFACLFFPPRGRKHPTLNGRSFFGVSNADTNLAQSHRSRRQRVKKTTFIPPAFFFFIFYFFNFSPSLFPFLLCFLWFLDSSIEMNLSGFPFFQFFGLWVPPPLQTVPY